MDMNMLMNIYMTQLEKEMVAKFKRKRRKTLKELRKMKGRNTRNVKNKICERLGLERLKPRRMTTMEKAIYNYAQQFNNLPKCIRDQIDA